ERLFGLDFDDQGYVYLANSYFGWGILDTSAKPTFHRSVDQMASDEIFPLSIVSLKTSDGRYYALIPSGGGANVWDVTDHFNAIKKPTLSKSLAAWAKDARGHVANVTIDGRIEIYTVDALVVGGAPLIQYGGDSFRAIASDGTNFYATFNNSAGLAITTI